MKLSNRGLNLIKEFEGLRLDAYFDPIGLLTVGYGHLCKKNEGFRLGVRITPQLAERLLASDVVWAENAVENLVVPQLSQNQFDALVSFTFNVGQTTFRRSSVLRFVNINRFDRANDYLLKYIYADGRKLKGLINRRQAESKLFLS